MVETATAGKKCGAAEQQPCHRQGGIAATIRLRVLSVPIFSRSSRLSLDGLPNAKSVVRLCWGGAVAQPRSTKRRLPRLRFRRSEVWEVLSV